MSVGWAVASGIITQRFLALQDKCMLDAEFQDLVNDLQENFDVEGDSVADVVKEINDRLTPLGLRLDHVRLDSGDVIWGLKLTSKEDGQKMRQAALLDHAQLEVGKPGNRMLTVEDVKFYKGVCDRFVKDRSALDDKALEEVAESVLGAGDARKYTKKEHVCCGHTYSDMDFALDTLKKNGWLVPADLDASGRFDHFLPGPRTYLEIFSDDDSVSDCPLCEQKTVIGGESCPNGQCPQWFHTQCIQEYFQQYPDRSCPSCRVKWPEEGGGRHGDDDDMMGS
ncbi:unnamed protein product [Vitrella brassicaformis CCMP3155]|uniref:Non-structural maintenance of chromosomes element 1 homolog n=1 Tax=Vitrella brassicaformis (strain CCMP3155) TaxID=1169540 RepID=A0A0G4FSM8_VITBC|nr:unnamed protein product [Vitrella brassicaformis CCMP3155]|eukprot:CEM17711.1 unnamed protein product [Vitrella brassicaformis CCMP3155]